LAEVIVDPNSIADGENYFIVYVDGLHGMNRSIVAEMRKDCIGPVTPELLRPRKLTGFALPAKELLQKAMERASERGVNKILLVDPFGLLPLASLNRYLAA
jgi:hypothetical protein